MNILVCFIILCHGGEIQLFDMHSKFVVTLLSKHLGNLTTTVCSKIKTKNSITIFYFSCFCSIYSAWFYKLICYSIFVTCIYSLGGRFKIFSQTIHHQFIGFLGFSPSFVSIHCKISTYNRHYSSVCICNCRF